jgi:hypothetical protein
MLSPGEADVVTSAEGNLQQIRNKHYSGSWIAKGDEQGNGNSKEGNRDAGFMDSLHVGFWNLKGIKGKVKENYFWALLMKNGIVR